MQSAMNVVNEPRKLYGEFMKTMEICVDVGDDFAA